MAAVRVIGLHQMPFDPVGFEEDAKVFDNHGKSRDECRAVFRSNWENAWIVVMEFDGPAAEIDFGEIAHPKHGDFSQAAWEEQIISDNPNCSIAAFFLHFVDPSEALYYESQRLTLPSPTPVPPEIHQKMKYCSP